MSRRTIAIVPARGGSKRVPRKNVREVGGKPLLAYTLEQAGSVSTFDEVVVSTDDDEIASVAERYGGSVPFERPASLATNSAPTSAVVTHALDWYEDQGERFDEVCLLQATSPLRTAADVEAALSRFRTADADSLVSVTKYDTPPQVALVVEDGFLVEKYDPPSVFSDEYVRSQDLDDPVHANGAIYVTTTDVWRREETFYTDRTVGYEMPPERSIDVDEPWHLDLADALLSRRHNS